MEKQVRGVNKSQVDLAIEQVFRQGADRVLASLIGSFRDFELAQDVLQEAFLAALEHWPQEGIPVIPAAWLLTTARRKALDRLRRNANIANKQTLLRTLAEIEEQEARQRSDLSILDNDPFPDERLKLMFTCCHPALSIEARVALTLHTLGGLTTTEIANAFLVSETTMAQRLVRAKRKIRISGIPYAVPAPDQLAERLDGVLTVLYLIFNAGYTAALGDKLLRTELCADAIHLNRALLALISTEPDLKKLEAEPLGLLSLMLLHDARCNARVGPQGELLVLEEQDRSRWNKAQIEEGTAILERALSLKKPGSYQIQAAISALHCQAAAHTDTDWFQIAVLYSDLVKTSRSPVLRLNWAVAVAMATNPKRGLALLAELESDPSLGDYYLFHAARADLYRRLKDWPNAAASYQQAFDLVQNSVEKAFLQRRLDEMHINETSVVV